MRYYLILGALLFWLSGCGGDTTASADAAEPEAAAAQDTRQIAATRSMASGGAFSDNDVRMTMHMLPATFGPVNGMAGMMGSMMGGMFQPVMSTMTSQMLSTMRMLLYNKEFRKDVARFALATIDSMIYEAMVSIRNGEPSFVGALMIRMMVGEAAPGSPEYNAAMQFWESRFADAFAARANAG